MGTKAVVHGLVMAAELNDRAGATMQWMAATRFAEDRMMAGVPASALQFR